MPQCYLDTSPPVSRRLSLRRFTPTKQEGERRPIIYIQFFSTVGPVRDFRSPVWYAALAMPLCCAAERLLLGSGVHELRFVPLRCIICTQVSTFLNKSVPKTSGPGLSRTGELRKTS